MKQQQVMPLLNDMQKQLKSLKKQLDRMELVISEPETAENLRQRARRDQDLAVQDFAKEIFNS